MLRLFYCICFVLLCIVNNIVGSQPGRVQFVAINCSGLVVAAIIFSAYKFKDFLKPIYAVWAVISLGVGAYAIYWGHGNYPYFGRWVTAVLNVAVYGFIVIRIVSGMLREKRVKPMKWVSLGLWVLMIALMVVSPHESVWPLWFGMMFLTLYFTEFDKQHIDELLNGLMDGILVGFVIVQGLAFLFRPYDIPRYLGFFANTNMNALFYVVTYAILLTKWCMSVRAGSKFIWKAFWAIFSCMMLGFVLLTGSKAALVAAVLVTVVFLALLICHADKKLITFIKYCVIVAVLGVISIPVTYFTVRYLPTVHLHPVYFEGEWSEGKVQPGESRDSEKYVSFKEYLRFNLGRILWFVDFDEETENSGTEEVAKIEEVTAPKEREAINEVYLLTEEEDEATGPIAERLLIHKYYLKHLNLFGHHESEAGVPITKYYTIPHAHNWILQMSFCYGIIAGMLLLYMVVQYIILVVRAAKAHDYRLMCLVGCMITAFLSFGFFEVTWAVGQIQFLLFFMLYYFVVTAKDWQTTDIVDK